MYFYILSLWMNAMSLPSHVKASNQNAVLVCVETVYLSKIPKHIHKSGRYGIIKKYMLTQLNNIVSKPLKFLPIIFKDVQ